jgi:hypothetical protein
MKAFERLMIGVRLDPAIHKKLKHICIERNESIQELVTSLIVREVSKDKTNCGQTPQP